MLEEKKISFISTDVLREIALNLIDKTKRNESFPFGNESNEEIFKLPTANIVHRQWQEALSLKSIINIFIRYEIDNDKDFVIEGVHIIPEIIAEFMGDDLIGEKIRAVTLIDKNEQQVLGGLKSNMSPGWLFDADHITLTKVAKFVAEFSVKVEQEAYKYKTPVFERTVNFKKDISMVLDLLLRPK
ncbi:MAG: hypothetical protein Q7S57_04130 [bacterium]|nr:hypothetical protein [bacterium]